MKPTVSVVMPTYNYGHYLAGALTSALGQTHADLEVLVIDDGSTDNTAAIMQPFLADERVRYYRRANQGPAAARNFGIAAARGTWVAFLDADDRWLPAKLEKQLARAATALAPGLVYTRRLRMDAEGRPLEFKQPRLYSGWVLPQLFRDNFVCFSSVMVRREMLDSVGGFDTTVEHSEDYELLLRLTSRTPVDFVDEPLVYYRTGHGNLSSQTEKRFRAVCAIMQRFLARGEHQLPRDLVRLSWAETYCHWGTARRQRSTLGAGAMYARSLWHLPAHAETWKGLASLCVPERLRRWRAK